MSLGVVMRRRAVAPLFGLAFASLALAQEREELTFHVELDPHQLSREVVRVRQLIESGAVEDGLALAEKLERDPRIREGLVEERPDHFVTLDRILRESVSGPEARRAYDQAHEPEVARLEEQGTRRALERLLALYPGSSRVGPALLRSAELALEAGDLELAAARFEDAAFARGLSPAEAERARVELPAAYALAGRRRACGEALAALVGDTETAARRLAILAAQERQAQRDQLAPVTTQLGMAAWVHETPDYYEPASGGSPAVSEPLLDASRAYVHDGSRCVACDLATGKLVFATPLRDDPVYRSPAGPCRIAAGDDVLACLLPLAPGAGPEEAAVVLVDRASGERLGRITLGAMKAAAGAGEGSNSYVNAVVSGEVLVVSLDLEDLSQELDLLGFDARTGAFLWRTVLGHMPMDRSPRRYVPVLAAGAGHVFVLPGGWGVVAALDPETGGVEWLVRYDQRPGFVRRVPVQEGRHRSFAARSEVAREGFLAFARGRLLVAAPDASYLRALDPRTGDVDWETDDGGGRVLAAYGEGVVEYDLDNGEGIVSVVARTKEPRARLARTTQLERAAVSGDVLVLPLARGRAYRVDLARAGRRGPRAQAEAEPDLALSEVLPCGPAHVAALGGSVVAAGSGTLVLLGEPAAVDSVALSFPSADAAAHALGDARFAVRDAASRALAAIGSDALAALDEAALSQDVERASRARAVRDGILTDGRRERFLDAYGHASKRGMAPPIDRLLGRDPQMRAVAVDRLYKANDPAYAPIFEELCSDPDPSVARIAAFGDMEHGGRAGLPVLARMLASPLARERRLVMSALEEHGRADDAPLLLAGLKDEDGQVRHVALRAAVLKGDARLVPEILRAIDDGVDVPHGAILQMVAGEAMVRRELAAPILRRLVHDESKEVRHRAVSALRRIAREKDAWLGLTEALEDKERVVWDAALVALLGELGGGDVPELAPGVMERILELSADPREHQLAPQAMTVAKRLLERGKPLRPGVFARVAFAEPAVQGDALLALRRSVDLAPVDSGDVAAIVTLTENLGAQDRARAYEVLLSARGPGRGAVLARGLGDPSPEVRSLVEQELPFGDTDVILELLALDEPDPAVARVLDACQPRVLAFAALRAADSADERLRARGTARLRALHATIERLVAAEKDPSLARRLREALARGSP
jgi:HEAT repeat protein